MNDPCFIWFFRENECKHMPDQLMLVLYPASWVIGLWRPSCVRGNLKSVFKEHSEHTRLSKLLTPPPPPPFLWNSSHKYFPMPSEFQLKEPLFAFRNPKSHPWYRYGYFLESPNVRVVAKHRLLAKLAVWERGHCRLKFGWQILGKGQWTVL